MEWELEQLRRGGLRSEDTIEKAPKPTYKPTPSTSTILLSILFCLPVGLVPSITPIPTLGPAIARLTHSLTALTTSHAQNTASMTSLADERTKLESREKEMRDMIANAEEKRSWFSAFREWVESVATFLDEKVGSSYQSFCACHLYSMSIVPSARKARRGTCLAPPGTISHDIQATNGR